MDAACHCERVSQGKGRAMSEAEDEVLNKCTGMKISLKEYARTPEQRAVNNEDSEVSDLKVKEIEARSPLSASSAR